jgi:hypothetical protein
VEALDMFFVKSKDFLNNPIYCKASFPIFAYMLVLGTFRTLHELNLFATSFFSKNRRPQEEGVNKKPHEAGKRTHHAVKQLAHMVGPIFPLVDPVAAIFASMKPS